MAETTGIQWADATWNPWYGCRKVSPGCKNCYMFTEKKRYGQDPTEVTKSKTKSSEPLKWRDPKFIFTCSWSDWFIEEADAWRDSAYVLIRSTIQHTYLVLTKRIERAPGRIPDPPFPNLWLGVSVENCATKYRIDLLRSTPAAVRFLSIEPLLEDIGELDLRGIDWVIVGGESGQGARRVKLEWIRSIIRQCRAAGVPVFVKQLGTYVVAASHEEAAKFPILDQKGGDWDEWPPDVQIRERPERRFA